MDQIIYSEKIQKKSVYKNKFEQYCQAQRQNFSPHSPAQREIATVHTKFRGTSPILSNRVKSYINASQTIQNNAVDPMTSDHTTQHQIVRGASHHAKHMSQVTNILSNHLEMKADNNASKYMTIGHDLPSQEGYPEILSQSREATSYKSNRLAQPGHKQPATLRSLKVKQKSPDGNKKLQQHIRIPVQIMSSNANPIQYQKNFKEDDQNNYNYNSILINRINANTNLSLEPSLSKIKTIKKKQFAPSTDKMLMSTSSPNRFAKFISKDNSVQKNVKSFGVKSGDNRSSRMLAPGVTSIVENKISPMANLVNDSANDIDTMTRKDTDYKTQQESDARPARSHSKKGTVAFTEKRTKRKHTIEGNQVSNFENTSVDMMPSVIKTPGIKKEIRRNRQKNQTEDHKQRGYLGAKEIQSMGYVNYVNGVPVSIQLNERDLFANDGVIGRHLHNKPISNWQQNMMLRNKAIMSVEAQRSNLRTDTDHRKAARIGMLDSQNSFHRANNTILNIQGPQGQILPQIDLNVSSIQQQKPFRPNNIKPDYYQKRRKANFSNMFEIFDDEVQTGILPNAHQNDFDSTIDPKRSIESDGYRTKGTAHVTDTASFKYNTDKKAKGYQSDGKHQRFNFRQTMQSDGKHSIEQTQRQNSVMKPKGLHNRTISNKSGPASPHNAMEEVEKIMHSPSKQEHPSLSQQTDQASSKIQKTVNTASAKAEIERKLQQTNHKKSKTTTNAAMQTRGLLQKAQEKKANADIKQAMSNDQFNDQPINLEINNKQTTVPKNSRIFDKPSENFDNSRKTRRQRLYPGANQQKTYEKIEFDPSLFKIRIMREDLEHLHRDDLDEISRFEVIYKILKDQLRSHQQKLIQLKETEAEEREKERIEKEKEELRLQREAYKNAPKTSIKAVSGYKEKDRQEIVSKMNKAKNSLKKDDGKSPSKIQPETVDLKEFVRHIRPFEWFGPQRDLSPELKRVVKNLTCQEHSYVYCPSCKSYDEIDYDPMENIKKFMKFIRQEQERLQKYSPDKSKQAQNRKNEKKLINLENIEGIPKKSKKDFIPDDSVSEITDLEEEEILAKYYRGVQNDDVYKKQVVEKEPEETENDDEKHKCKTKKKETEEERHRRFMNETIELELKKPQFGVTMHDEKISAHQFSYRNISVQADSEERLEMEMQASDLENKSQGEYYFDKIKSSKSLKSTRSINVTSFKEVPRQSNGKLRKEDMLFKPWIQRSDAGMQTEFNFAIASKLKLELAKTASVDQVPDADENDFDLESENEQIHQQMDTFKEDWSESLVFKQAIKAEKIKRGLPFEDDEVEDNDQLIDKYDPDNSQDANSQEQVGLGFLKKFNEKGNIQMLTEQEVTYVKSLLKQEAEIWESQSTLEDLFRHCKFTIRMLTRSLARIDNRQLFRENQEIARESTLVMVYRSEMLYQAKSDAQRIFMNLARYDLDQDEFDRRIQKTTKQLSDDDEKFLNKREHLIKRILSQINNFMSMYKIFNDKFVFKQMDIYEFLHAEIDKIKTLKALHEKYKAEMILGISKEKEPKSNQNDAPQPNKTKKKHSPKVRENLNA